MRPRAVSDAMIRASAGQTATEIRKRLNVSAESVRGAARRAGIRLPDGRIGGRGRVTAEPKFAMTSAEYLDAMTRLRSRVRRRRLP